MSVDGEKFASVSSQVELRKSLDISAQLLGGGLGMSLLPTAATRKNTQTYETRDSHVSMSSRALPKQTSLKGEEVDTIVPIALSGMDSGTTKAKFTHFSRSMRQRRGKIVVIHT